MILEGSSPGSYDDLLGWGFAYREQVLGRRGGN